eukprot:358519-Chlamydomonas_euryale.AAC.2
MLAAAGAASVARPFLACGGIARQCCWPGSWCLFRVACFMELFEAAVICVNTLQQHYEIVASGYANLTGTVTATGVGVWDGRADGRRVARSDGLPTRCFANPARGHACPPPFPSRHRHVWPLKPVHIFLELKAVPYSRRLDQYSQFNTGSKASLK